MPVITSTVPVSSAMPTATVAHLRHGWGAEREQARHRKCTNQTFSKFHRIFSLL